MQYIVIILIILLGTVYWDDNNVREKNTDLNVRLGSLQTTVQIEKQIVNVCDTNTKELKTAEDKKTEEVKKAVQKAQSNTKTHEKKAEEILKTQPDPKLDELAQLKKELDNYVDTRTQDNAKKNPISNGK